jgi:hypothetical protein
MVTTYTLLDMRSRACLECVLDFSCVLMYVCMHVSVYVYLCDYVQGMHAVGYAFEGMLGVCVALYMCVCVCIYMYVCMYVCMYGREGAAETLPACPC